MNNLTRGSLLMITTLGLSNPVMAENWVGVYTYPEPNNTVIYVDTDSASRKGEIATIYQKMGVEPRTLQTYDCVRQKRLQSWPDKKILDIDEASRPSFDQACKSRWVLW